MTLFLAFRITNQADAGEEKDAAQDQVNERSLRDAPFGEVDAAVDQASQTGQG